MRELYSYQEKALDYAWGRNHVAYCMEMRLGKTLTTIRWVQELPDCPKTCVVIAPLTVLDTWQRELAAEGECFIPCYGLSKLDRLDRVAMVANTRKRKWLLINYEGVMVTPIITVVPWDVVICDESTYLRNPQAKRTRMFCAGFRGVKHRVILTGMIRPESDLDVFQQFKFLHGRFMGYDDYYRWRSRYFRRSFDGRDWEPKPEARSYIKEMVHKKAFVLTRRQAGMRKKKIYETRIIEMSAPQKKMYQQAEDEFAMRLESGEEIETQWVIVMRNWLQHLTGGFDPDRNFVSAAKKNELLELLEGELRKQKFVVWFKYRHELLYIQDALREKGIDTVSVLGGTPQEVRSQRMQQFRQNKHTLGFLATEKCARFGIDVSAASVAIYYSNECGYEDRGQSEDRILHPGKREPLLYIDLVCRGTVDVDIVGALREKKTDSTLFMNQFTHELLKRRGRNGSTTG